MTERAAIINYVVKTYTNEYDSFRADSPQGAAVHPQVFRQAMTEVLTLRAPYRIVKRRPPYKTKPLGAALMGAKIKREDLDRYPSCVTENLSTNLQESFDYTCTVLGF